MEISIIITNHNYGKYLPRAIRSAINQSFNKDEYEIIVIDDCSTDNSKSIIEGFGSIVKPIYNDVNVGIAESCNRAIRSAMGAYTIRLDADDFVSRDWLKVHHLFLSYNKGEMDATSSDYLEVDGAERVLCRKNGMTWPIACGIMYKTDHMLDLNLYDCSLPREDIDFRQKFMKSGRQMYNLPVPLYRYTQHPESITKKGKDK
jgi:glycosyltransferase involved in cell wall biosynthesis